MFTGAGFRLPAPVTAPASEVHRAAVLGEDRAEILEQSQLAIAGWIFRCGAREGTALVREGLAATDASLRFRHRVGFGSSMARSVSLARGARARGARARG